MEKDESWLRNDLSVSFKLYNCTSKFSAIERNQTESFENENVITFWDLAKWRPDWKQSTEATQVISLTINRTVELVIYCYIQSVSYHLNAVLDLLSYQLL